MTTGHRSTGGRSYFFRSRSQKLVFLSKKFTCLEEKNSNAKAVTWTCRRDFSSFSHMVFSHFGALKVHFARGPISLFWFATKPQKKTGEKEKIRAFPQFRERIRAAANVITLKSRFEISRDGNSTRKSKNTSRHPISPLSTVIISPLDTFAPSSK